MWQVLAVLCIMRGDAIGECHTAILPASYTTLEECGEAARREGPAVLRAAQAYMMARGITSRSRLQVRCDVPPGRA